MTSTRSMPVLLPTVLSRVFPSSIMPVSLASICERINFIMLPCRKWTCISSHPDNSKLSSGKSIGLRYNRRNIKKTCLTRIETKVSYPSFATYFPISYSYFSLLLEATVYVGNLDDRVTDALLWELFVQAGPVGTLIHSLKNGPQLIINSACTYSQG